MTTEVKGFDLALFRSNSREFVSTLDVYLEALEVFRPKLMEVPIESFREAVEALKMLSAEMGSPTRAFIARLVAETCQERSICPDCLIANMTEVEYTPPMLRCTGCLWEMPVP